MLANTRFEVLKEVVDYFIICESQYDYRGNKKKINFKLINKKFKEKVRHIIINNSFPKKNDLWSAEEYQREMIFKGIEDAKNNDYVKMNEDNITEWSKK